MRLTILGSSSSGNSYILHNDKEALIIECGIRFSEVKQTLNFDITKVVGCLITHEHGDHSKYVNDVLNCRIMVFASSGTIKGMKLKTSIQPIAVESEKQFGIGNFKILPFRTKHDCNEPLGFLISHQEIGTMLFATDTYYLPFTFSGLTNILLECNYSDEILNENIQKGIVHPALRDRTMLSHMSLKTCIKTLQANNLSKVNNIILIHLSSRNSDEIYFQKIVSEKTGKNVIIAKKGLEIEFNKHPF